MTPVRIQRRRTRGWRVPPGAIYVGRPSPWGNPVAAGERVSLARMPELGWTVDAAGAVALYRHWIRAQIAEQPRGLVLSPLRGHDLVCWCALDQPCHADVLLELANA